MCLASVSLSARDFAYLPPSRGAAQPSSCLCGLSGSILRTLAVKRLRRFSFVREPHKLRSSRVLLTVSNPAYRIALDVLLAKVWRRIWSTGTTTAS
jgi:hypothetical protein